VGTVKIKDEDDVQKERRKLRNAKRAARRQRISEQHQHQPGNLYDFATMNLCNVINVGRDARNVIIAGRQERIKVEAYSPTNYHIPQGYLNPTRKRKTDAPDATTE
jgi:sigma54-dependent transcription regulator